MTYRLSNGLNLLVFGKSENKFLQRKALLDTPNSKLLFALIQSQ